MDSSLCSHGGRVKRRDACLRSWSVVVLFVAVLFACVAADAAKMYWTDSGSDRVQRSRLDGSNIENLVTTGLIGPYGIALDLVNGKIYWTDNGSKKVQRANLDGTSVEDLVTTGLNIPLGIALDVAGGKMYWVDQTLQRIQRANLDGTSVENLITTGLARPYGIELDLAAGKMYFSDWSLQKIMRANLDGTGIEDVVVLGGTSQILDIALDIAGGKVYWADNGTNKVQRANLDGTNVEDLVTLIATATPLGIDLDLSAGKMYWADSTLKRISVANLDGSNVVNLVTALNTPRFIAIDPRNAAPEAENALVAPATPVTADDLTGTYDYSDDDGDAESGSQIRWYKDAALESAYNDLLTVPAAATAKGEAWYFEVTPSDGKDLGSAVQSNTVTIGNTAPASANAALAPEPVYVDSVALTLTYDYDDVDGDPESGTLIQWYRNGVLDSAYDGQTVLDVSATTPVAGDEWYATVLASDGTDAAPLLTSPTVEVIAHLSVALDGPAVIDAIRGNRVEMSVTVTGGVVANYAFQWQFTPAAKEVEAKDFNDQILVLDPVQLDDAGTYVCQVTDGFDVVMSDAVTLNVDPGVPAAGLAGLLAFAAASGLGGVVLIRRKEKK